MVKIIIFVCLAYWANAYDLSFKEGQIKAHTEVFGDAQINPSTTNITSTLSIKDNIDSIKGNISINYLSLVSQKTDRDENMYELINSKLYPKVLYTIKEIIPFKENYKINGTLTLNGITQKVSSTAFIKNKNDVLAIHGEFSILATQFNIEPPTMFFVSVRDKIDITYNLTYKKENK